MEQNITVDAKSVFSTHLLNSRSLYLCTFNRLPNEDYIPDIDGMKACSLIREKYAHLIEHDYQFRIYDDRKKCMRVDETFFVMKNNCILEVSHKCEVFHDGNQQPFIDELIGLLRKCKGRRKRVPLEVNLIVKGSYGLDLRSMEIKRTPLDIGLFYEDDFAAVDAIIQKRLNQKNDKGIVLLHGLPGTGKTTYLRYLVGKIRKRVLFLSPNIAENLTDPGFIDLLIDNPNSVVVIEDAENILLDRKVNSHSGVANLLNISDGLLADFLNVQLICTFNSPLTMVDSALTRKGRLIARYHFDKLSVLKARRLSRHMKFETEIFCPMTVAEICNQEERDFDERKTDTIGFRTKVLEN